MPISKSLDLDVSDREDRAGDFGRTNNGKLSVRFQPYSFLTLRGTASTGFRAPTLFDLYQPNNIEASDGQTMGTNNPFCVTPAATGLWTTATCGSQGLGLFGGNKHLTPETSENFDVGAIISPIRNMGITLDYYRILVSNAIGAIPAESIYENPTQFANQIVPNSSGGLTQSIAEGAFCTPYTNSVRLHPAERAEYGRRYHRRARSERPVPATYGVRNVPRGPGRNHGNAVPPAAVQRRPRAQSGGLESGRVTESAGVPLAA